jgi:hypothetical protein
LRARELRRSRCRRAPRQDALDGCQRLRLLADAPGAAGAAQLPALLAAAARAQAALLDAYRAARAPPCNAAVAC